MSTLQFFPIGQFLVRCERALGIVPSLCRDTVVSEFVDEAARHTPLMGGQDWGGAPHAWISLGFCFGQNPRFGDEPDGRRRINRLVRAAVAESGGLALHPAAPLHFLAHVAAFGEPWLRNQIFARIDALRPGGYWPVQRVVFLHEPVRHGASYCDLFAIFREEVGTNGFRVGVVSGDDGYSFGDDTAYVFGLPVTKTTVP